MADTKDKTASGLRARLLALPAVRQLAEDDEWLRWAFERNADGREAKIPKRPLAPGNASHSDPATWGSLDDALRGLDLFGGDGVGRVITKSGKYTGLDFDDSLDPETLAFVNPMAEGLVRWLDSYTEVSPSGAGVKVWVKGKLPTAIKVSTDELKLEVYSENRYFTVTGRHLAGTPESIRDRQTELETIAELYGSRRPRRQPRGRATLPEVKAALDGKDIGYREFASEGKTVLRLDRCLTSDAHVDGAWITCHSDGTAHYACFHTSCQGAEWANAAVKLGLDPTPVSTGPYRETDDGIVWRRRERNRNTGPGQPAEVINDIPLTNFTARIVSDVVEDDGAEERRRFDIETVSQGRRKRFALPASEFQGMGWPATHAGAGAVVCAGQGLRDHARAAIQLLSGDVPERHVFTHSGWREINGEPVYLTAGAVIGADGVLPDVEVLLPLPLAGLALPEPPTGEAERAAVRASLNVLGIAPDHITVPFLAAMYRAPLGPADFSLHIAGPTGVGKSELAALTQQHFGAGWDARHLLGWASTANSLEALAFQAKDALIVYDDFAPNGGLSDIQRQHREADRLFRAQGNHAGRNRLRPDGTLRPDKPPRATILSTGEDVPKGQSLRARLFVIEVEPGHVDWSRLTSAQRDAANGLYAQSTSGFVKWQAGRRIDLVKAMPDALAALRERATAEGMHRRTPATVASLAYGFGAFLDYAIDVGAVSESERADLWDRAWAALGIVAGKQAGHQAASDPVLRFLDLLGAAIASGAAGLASLTGQSTDTSDYAGNPGRGTVGWLDGDDLYLEPDAAFAAAQRMGQGTGDPLSITAHTLRKRLHERGFLASTGLSSKRESLLIRRMIDGQRRNVLHLLRETLFGTDEEGGEA